MPTSSTPTATRRSPRPDPAPQKSEIVTLRERLSRNDVEIIELKTVRATALSGLHFTPTYSSWLNLVERFFGYVTADLLQRSDHDQILASLGRLIQRIGNSGH